MSTSSSHPAARLYNARASTYDDSWHSNFVHLIPQRLPKPPPKARILDLACGTGLSTFALASSFQDASAIIGVDISSGMLSEAHKKLSPTTSDGPQIEFYEHDILDLDSLAAVQDSGFDVITCVSAFVLLPDPHAALRSWCRYLAPGGVIVLDATHPKSLIAGMVLERTAAKINISVPYHRSWSRSEDSLREVFEKAGLEVLDIKYETQQGGERSFYDADAATADSLFDQMMDKEVGAAFHVEQERNPAFLERAREVFRNEWAAEAAEEQLEEVDGVWIGVARKLASSIAPGILVNQPKVVGGCRCSAVRYEVFRHPTGTLVCHCFSCGRLSGAGNLPFLETPTNSFRFTERRGLKTLRLSDVADRTFCGECGSPITMVYYGTPGYENEKGKVNIILGSVDMDSLDGEVPKVSAHIYLGEKCVWEVLPDDGARRMRKFTA